MLGDLQQSIKDIGSTTLWCPCWTFNFSAESDVFSTIFRTAVLVFYVGLFNSIQFKKLYCPFKSNIQKGKFSFSHIALSSKKTNTINTMPLLIVIGAVDE